MNFLPVEDVTELNRRFTSQRATLPDMFLVTPYDLHPVARSDAVDALNRRFKHASLWTKGSVSLQILYRSKQLAEAALDFLNKNLLSNDMDIMVTFRKYVVCVKMLKTCAVFVMNPAPSLVSTCM